MKQKEQVQLCERCHAKNSVDSLRCQRCDGVLPGVPSSKPVKPPRPRLSNRVKLLSFISISIVLILILTLYITHFILPQPLTPTPTPAVPLGVHNGIGVTLVGGEYIGISDGSYALDTNRPGGDLKIQAAASLRAGNVGSAIAQWRAALDRDSNDAESHIYLQDQQVLASGSPYLTIVIGTSLNDTDTYSHDILQGAYIAQQECNNDPSLSGGMKLRILIAKSGSNAAHSKDIAQQIVQATQADSTIVGVLGWPTTVTSLNAIRVLAQAHIPMIAASAAGNDLTGISPYFFRVTATSNDQAHLLTKYIETKLKPQRLVLFKDENEPYSQDLADTFAREFGTDGYSIAATLKFQTGKNPAVLSTTVQNMLKTYNPDVVFFTSTNVNDTTTLLNAIPATQQYAALKVVMGGSGYSLVEAGTQFTGYNRIRFAATAFPDAWETFRPGSQQPLFFAQYQQAFDPEEKHTANPYTYIRPTSYCMLGYDAMSSILDASQMLRKEGKQTFGGDELRQALAQINGLAAFQGISGTISFDAKGNPMNKAVFILRVDANNHLNVDAYQGCYFIDTKCDGSVVLSV